MVFGTELDVGFQHFWFVAHTQRIMWIAEKEHSDIDTICSSLKELLLIRMNCIKAERRHSMKVDVEQICTKWRAQVSSSVFYRNEATHRALALKSFSNAP